MSIIREGVVQDMGTLKGLMDALLEGGTIQKDGNYYQAFLALEAYCALSLRVIEATDPVKLGEILRVD